MSGYGLCNQNYHATRINHTTHSKTKQTLHLSHFSIDHLQAVNISQAKLRTSDEVYKIGLKANPHQMPDTSRTLTKSAKMFETRGTLTQHSRGYDRHGFENMVNHVLRVFFYFPCFSFSKKKNFHGIFETFFLFLKFVLKG